MNNDDDDEEIRSWSLLVVKVLHFCIMSVKKKNQLTILEGVAQHNSKLQCSNINKIPLKCLCTHLKQLILPI